MNKNKKYIPSSELSSIEEVMQQMGVEELNIGFTGRHDMTDEQSKSMEEVVKRLPKILSAHHGDCVGADTEFHKLSIELGIPVHIHPPTNSRFRSFCQDATVIAKEKGYLKRNQEIVSAIDVLIAAPPVDKEVQRSGTWATIRYARKASKLILIIQQDGAIVIENLAEG